MTEHPLHALHLQTAAACAGPALLNRAYSLDEWARLWTLTADWHRAQAERHAKGDRP